MSRTRCNVWGVHTKPVVLASSLILLLAISTFGTLPGVHGLIPDDPVGNPWHLEAIKIHSVWDHGYSFYSPDAIGLCVIGYAITDTQNGDLNVTEKASFGWNADISDYLPYPTVSESSHEGACASVAASAINNGLGVAGIVNAPLYAAWPWGNYPEDDVTYYHTYVQQMIDIFEWGASFGRMVFSMSFLETVYLLESDDAVLVELQNKVIELYESGKALFFAAVDNTLYPLHPKDIPQSLPNVRAVGRINSEDSYVDGGYGEQMFLIAPAGGVPAYMEGTGTYSTFGGSSCSTPIAAASAVLLWNQFPWATNGQIEDALVWGATDILESGWDEKSGYGALDIDRARAYLAAYVPSANSFRLNWSALDEVTISTLEPTTNITSTTESDLTALILYIGVSIPIITGVIILGVLFKRKRTSVQLLELRE